jgi:hypothetical protein
MDGLVEGRAQEELGQNNREREKGKIKEKEKILQEDTTSNRKIRRFSPVPPTEARSP